MAECQAMLLDNASSLSEAGKSIQNPFQSSKKVGRSPMRARSHSLVENYREKQQQNAGMTALPQRKATPPQCSAENGGFTSSTHSEETVIIKSLESQLNATHKEIKKLREIIASLQSKEKYTPTNSDDEEELVAKETAWLLPKYKKRKFEESPEKRSTTSKSKSSLDAKKYKPPPVILSNVEDYTEIRQAL